MSESIYVSQARVSPQIGINYHIPYTAQKMKFSITDFFSKCDQIHSKLRIWSHLLKKSVTENFIFCAVVAFYTLFVTPLMD